MSLQNIMLVLPNYHVFQKIYESDNSIVYRGSRQSDQQPVILKLLKGEYPPPESLARYKIEYEITRQLDIDGVAKAYSLEKYRHSFVIVLEDFSGESLRIWLKSRQFNLLEILTLFQKTALIIGQIHRQNIIHKDLNPSNIVFNPITGQLKIIDFGISTILDRENETLKNPNVLEGTLAYMSPEQTGRMNRSLDYRTDFYSLGVTFYELLTGQLPFNTSEPMELVHCHIAKQPIPPYQINPEIPEVFSNLVMKLLAKTAEERYQSAWGLQVDLERIQEQLSKGYGIETFTLGSQDSSDKFQVPQKLYGREKEIESLLKAFDRISQGFREIIFVAGYSGIGKSALVQEIYKPITKHRGYFITGKFDQFQRNIPYSALIKAFQDLIRQLLTETESKLQQWREQILLALGPNGQIIIDAIPDVELIIGSQPPVTPLGPTESQNRFNLVFQNFIQVFSQPEHPLAIFLDDLQWADLATLKLVETILTESDRQYLLVIGAYRDHEINPSHPLTTLIENLRQEGTNINTITLAPLTLEQITYLLADTLKSEIQQVESLAKLILRKTEGNPFFINELLKTLYTENLLVFQEGSWQWDLSQLESLGISDNVVDLTITKLKKLPDVTQKALRFAACVGNIFDLHTLAIVLEQEPVGVAMALFAAIQAGVIIPLGIEHKLISVLEDNQPNANQVIYKFRHDRIQQAAYSLIDEEAKKSVHLKIGRLLLDHVSTQEREEKIFEMINQLNLGRDLITDTQEQLQLAELNLEAGKKAKNSTAYAAALNYLNIGLESLPPESWREQYNLTLELYQERATVEYLYGNFGESEALVMTIIEQARSPLEKAEVQILLIIQYTLQSKYQEAIQAGRQALALLGIDLPETNLGEAIKTELSEVNKNLGEQSIASLIDVPEINSDRIRLAMKLLANIGTTAYLSDRQLYIMTALKRVNLSLQHGQAPECASAYYSYGIVLGSLLGNYRSGYEFGRLSLEVAAKFNDLEQKSRACLALGFFIQHWVKPLQETYTLAQDCYQAGLESGNLQYAGYSLAFYLAILFSQGEPLTKILLEIPKPLHFSQKTKNRMARDITLACSLVVLNLTGATPEPLIFNSEEISESEFRSNCSQYKSFIGLALFLIFKTFVLYLYEEFRDAWNCHQEAEKILNAVFNTEAMAEHYFYGSLLLTSLYPQATATEQKEYLEIITSYQQKMQTWAEHCPENFLHKYLLVEAERTRLTGEILEAANLYDRAIESAMVNNFSQYQALANELAAKFWLEHNKEHFARLYMTEAHYNYQLWGAKRKVEYLEQKYSYLLAKVPLSKGKIDPIRTTTTTTTTSNGNTSVLDLETVLKASQVLSGEIVLDQLLSKLMQILIENAGAEKGYLILETQGRLFIEAESEITRERVTVLQSTPLEEFNSIAKTIINYVQRIKESIVLDRASEEGKFINDPYIQAEGVKSILCTPLLNQGKLIGIVYLENNLTTAAFTPDRLEILNVLSSQAAISLENARLYFNLKALNQAYARFVPEEFLQFLNKDSIIDVQLGDTVQQDMSVLFSDIRDFTTLSERMNPRENFQFINDYLSRMGPIIREHQGFIDKYIGDAIMALFSGAADNALRAGIEMLNKLREYNHYRWQNGKIPLEIGIGVNTGSLMLGMIGETNRMEGTVISDTVNLASRIEGLTKNYGASLLISHNTLARLENPMEYQLRLIDQVKTKGKLKAVAIFEVFNAEAPALQDLKLATKGVFEAGVLFYYSRAFEEAERLFSDCLRQNPQDRVAQIYFDRCQQQKRYTSF